MKMKTVRSNKPGKVYGVVNQIIYSLHVLLVGLFIPFLFVFGISYKMPHTSESSSSINKHDQVRHTDNTVDLGKLLSEKNS